MGLKLNKGKANGSPEPPGGHRMDEYNKKVLEEAVSLRPVVWINPRKEDFSTLSKSLDMGYADMLDAEERLRRFAPLVRRLFPETVDGIIESDLVRISSLKWEIERVSGRKAGGELLLKCDNNLKIAGSVKARGGIYEVLKYAETLAVSNGLLSSDENYEKIAGEKIRNLFSNYRISVGSTGNLGLSIGIVASALGFKASVHMSRDAKQWKKDLLRKRGVEVIEYDDDYSKAVEAGRRQCEGDVYSYFVDDENSRDLFLGYSTAAIRLHSQLMKMGINVGKDSPLNVYLPCGVGGAPGGIAFGLKHIYGDSVRCYFVEPVHSPCMLLGLLTGKYSSVHINDYGIDNITEADGLAVGSPSLLVSKMAEKMIDGLYTIDDSSLLKLLALLYDSENIKIEPSAAAGLAGPFLLKADENVTHISWATGGVFLPEKIYCGLYNKGRNLLINDCI